jgi:hypothetical protein
MEYSLQSVLRMFQREQARLKAGSIDDFKEEQ